jgi:hypothetical protein
MLGLRIRGSSWLGAAGRRVRVLVICVEIQRGPGGKNGERFVGSSQQIAQRDFPDKEGIFSATSL